MLKNCNCPKIIVVTLHTLRLSATPDRTLTLLRAGASKQFDVDGDLEKISALQTPNPSRESSPPSRCLSPLPPDGSVSGRDTPMMCSSGEPSPHKILSDEVVICRCCRQKNHLKIGPPCVNFIIHIFLPVPLYLLPLISSSKPTLDSNYALILRENLPSRPFLSHFPLLVNSRRKNRLI